MITRTAERRVRARARRRDLAVLLGSVLALAAIQARPAAAQTYDSLVRDAQQQLAKMNEFASLEAESRRMLKAGRFDDARDIAQRALALNVANRRANALLGEIDAAERAAVPPPPVAPPPPARSSGSPALAPDRGAPSRVVAPPRRDRPTPADAGRVAQAQAVRQALRAYFTGDYVAVLALQQASTGTEPPRLLFYAACSEVALGLLEKGSAGERFERAQGLYARAMESGLPFTRDRLLVSPRVLDVLDDKAPAR
jgi:hypothetical protein